jgi:hypothetical protein
MKDSASDQNLLRSHYELGVEVLPGMILAAAFGELTLLI